MAHQATHSELRFTTLEASLASKASGAAEHSREMGNEWRSEKHVIATEQICIGNAGCQASALSKHNAVKLSGFTDRVREI